MRNKAIGPKNQVQNSTSKKHVVHGAVRIYAETRWSFDAICGLVTDFKLDRSGTAVALLMSLFMKLDKNGQRVELTTSRWESIPTLAKRFKTTEKSMLATFGKLYKQDILAHAKIGRFQRGYAFSLTFIDWIRTEAYRLKVIHIILDEQCIYSALQPDQLAMPSLCLKCHRIKTFTCKTSSSRGGEKENRAGATSETSSSRGGETDIESALSIETSSSRGGLNDEAYAETSSSRGGQNIETSSSRGGKKLRPLRHADRDLLVTRRESNELENPDFENPKEEEEEEKIEPSPSPNILKVVEQNQNAGRNNVVSISKNARHLERSPFWGTLKEHVTVRRSQARMDNMASAQPIQSPAPSQTDRLIKPRQQEARFNPEIDQTLANFAPEERKMFFRLMDHLITKSQRQGLSGDVKELVYQSALKLVRCGNYDGAMREIEDHLATDGVPNIHEGLKAYAMTELGGNVTMAWKGFLDQLREKYLRKK